MTIHERSSDTLRPLDNSTVEAFAQSLRGELIRRGDAGYDAARTVFNRMIDKRPALIARCAGVADVIAAVNFARRNNLLIAVRGGGHSVSGYSVCDDGLVIDLSRMKGLYVDPIERTVRAEPGLTWGELNHELQVFGLGATGGYVSITGIGGLTLSGGYGWLVRKHGLALDNLRSVDLVTAEGELLTADATRNPELYWGVRGGGGNFGIVTSFEFNVYPVGQVLAGLVIHPRTAATDLVRYYREQSPSFPDELTSAVLLFHLPAAPFLPPEMHGLPVAAIAVCYAGDLAAGEAVLRPIRAFGQPLADTIEALPYRVAQTGADALWPPGLHYYWKSSYLSDFDDAAVATFVEFAERAPSDKTVVLIEQSTSDALREIDPHSAAFPHRAWPLNFLISTGWEDAADTGRNIDWTRAFMSAMKPHLEDASYSNYTFLGDANENWRHDAYGENQRRLINVKNRYDPANLFRLNPNIEPRL